MGSDVQQASVIKDRNVIVLTKASARSVLGRSHGYFEELINQENKRMGWNCNAHDGIFL